MKKSSDTSIINGVIYRQTDFLSELDNPSPEQPQTSPVLTDSKSSQKKTTGRRPLPPNQQAGFRKDYEDAKITLYIIGVLLNSVGVREDSPEEIKKEFERAQKVQERYERYMPNAAQAIVHFGREVVDAYTCGNSRFLNQKEEEAYREAQALRKRLQKKGKTLTSPTQKQRMFYFTVNKIEQMISIIRQHNEK